MDAPYAFYLPSNNLSLEDNHRLAASFALIMSPYHLDHGLPMEHLSLMISWLYEASKKRVEGTGMSFAVVTMVSALIAVPSPHHVS